MTDRQFDLFLENTIKNLGEDYIDFSEEAIIPYTFSKKFERKMARLIRQQKSFYFPMIRTPLRRTATIIFTVIIILSAMVMSVSALREAFIHFITETFSTHTEVQTLPDNNAPESFEDIYFISNIPYGFEIVFQNDNIEETPVLITKYQKGQQRIIFSQYIKSRYDVSVNTEGYELVRVDINGNEGFIVNMVEDFNITWDNGDYIFVIESNINKNDLIYMANSVEKVE